MFTNVLLFEVSENNALKLFRISANSYRIDSLFDHIAISFQDLVDHLIIVRFGTQAELTKASYQVDNDLWRILKSSQFSEFCLFKLYRLKLTDKSLIF